MSDGASAGALSPAHDPGPPSSGEGLFAEAPLAHYLGHASGRFRLHFGPVFYRGRLNGAARVLVLGQDPGTDELLGHRSLVGQSGQRVQRLLGKLGVTRSYVMFNAFLFGVFGQFDAELRSISEEPPILGWRTGCSTPPRPKTGWRRRWPLAPRPATPSSVGLGRRASRPSP